MTALNLDELNPENIVAYSQENLASLPTVEILPTKIGVIDPPSSNYNVRFTMAEVTSTTTKMQFTFITLIAISMRRGQVGFFLHKPLI